MEGKQNGRFILYFPSADNIQPLGRRASAPVVVALEEKNLNNQSLPPLPPFPQLLLLSMVLHGREYPCGQLSQVSQLVPSQPLAHPQPTGFCGGQGEMGSWRGVGEKALMLCDHCSAIAKTLAYYQHHSSQKCKAWHYMDCY